MEDADPDYARPTPKTPTVEQADDDYNRSQQLNQRMKKTTHDGNATEDATRNYNTISSSPLQFHSVGAAEKDHEIKYVGHFLASWGPF